MKRSRTARRGSGARRLSKPARPRNRVIRLARVAIAYATPVRAVLIGALPAGLLVAVLVEQPIVQIAGVAVATLGIVALLALNRRTHRGRSGLARTGAAASADGERPARRAIGRSDAIVTVIIPGKNEAAFARDCIRSLKSQTLTNFAVVAIDDGSTDTTLDVLLDEIGDDQRFRIIRTPQSVGIGRARNLGVAAATTKYITFLDMDDFYAPHALADRVELAEKHADMPWVAGTYCWHEMVGPEAGPEAWQPPTNGRSGNISWMSHIDDNVVIVTTPLLRRDAFLALGGFDGVPTAEDSTFWFKLLRWGYVLVGTGNVGVAYRQKPASHAISTALEMRNVVARLLTERTEAVPAPASLLGPYFFSEGVGSDRSALGFTRRTASALGMAIAAGSPNSVIEGLVDDLRDVPFPFVGWEADVRGRAMHAARRVTLARGEQAREAVIERDIERCLAPLIADAERAAGKWLAVTEHPPMPTGASVRPVKQQPLVPVTPQSLRSLTSAGRPFLLLPSAAYHTDELIELVDELRSRGFAPLAILNEARWATTGRALARIDVPVAKAMPPGDWLFDFDALLTFNDWGEYFGEYVRYVKDRRTISFAKVEGVQDWLDTDTGRVRNPYLQSDVILCQGSNDVAALEGRRGSLEIVGSARLEAIWNDPLPADAAPRVVGNVNFTYGVQTDHRDLWVETLSQACRRASVPLDLSLHPNEAASYPDLASPDPIRHLMVRDSILVSRFSTVLFEGMARGCSVIYYNPHGEQVPTFQNPEGAFDIAKDPETLASLIEACKARKRVEAKARATEFFLRQVSIERGSSVAIRTVEAISRRLSYPGATSPTAGGSTGAEAERPREAHGVDLDVEHIRPARTSASRGSRRTRSPEPRAVSIRPRFDRSHRARELGSPVTNQQLRPLPEPSTREQVVERYARVRLNPDHAAIHEETIGAVYSSILGSGDTAVDGGAHSGKHTLPMAQAVGPLGRVIASEPLDEARRQLEQKLEAGAFDMVEVSPSALWDTAGETMEFLYFPQRPGVSGFRRRTDGGALDAERRMVTTTTVDALVGVGNVSFVKLDVEGAELLALRGAEQVVRRSRPTVHVEAGTVSWQAYNLDAGDLDAWCQEHGYACFDVVGTPVTSKESLSVSFGTAGVWDYILVDRASASWEPVVLALHGAARRFGLDPT